ncbi:MAG: AAA family ATPase [Thermodesulfobacteriota bacterium]|nr:AAA family ATPase [Thermodesulfobacteriota bacterium]
MNPDSKEQMPLIFLTGPPGSGKSSLGKKACQKLELRFVDLSTLNINNQSFLSQKEILTEVINKRSADAIALPWSLQQDKGMRTLTRRFGVLLLLWAHPLDMQTRSGHSESLFTPSSRIKTKGGFGRNGTGCREFRRLDNAADEVLILVGSSFDEAVGELQDYIVSIRKESLESPVIRAGLSGLADDWQQDYDISKNIANIIVDAMARYILYLRSEGKSSRTLSGVYSDLEAAGMLVIAYDYPTRKKAAEVLDLFSYPPWTIEFKRKFSDSSNAIARYERNLKGFARFLKNS